MTINTNSINSRKEIKKLDPEDVLGSIEALADQVRHAWKDVNNLDFSFDLPPQNIVVAGMGGSALGASVVEHLFKNSMTIPFEIVNDYQLPAHVNKNTLVILSSYSGNTEETLACGEQAISRNAMIMVITAGGKLAQLAQDNNFPCYLIDPKYNPSNQPRMAIGYAITGLIAMLAKLKLISIAQNEIDEVTKTILVMSNQCAAEIETDDNPAKTLTFSLIDRRPNLIAAEFLTGAVHVASNQFNENAKTFASYYQIPEINHHLLESLELPKSNHIDNIFVFFDSKLYHPRNSVRISLTQEAVNKQNCESLVINLEAESKFAQVFELITLCAFSNFYLALLNQINPSKIPIVDWFKKELEKRN